MTIWKSIKRWSIFVLLGSPLFMPVQAAEKPVVRAGKDPAIEVIQINPSKGDIRRARQKRKQRGQDDAREIQVHVVKLYVEMPSARAEGYRLYIGDRPVEEAGSFPEGLFMKVYEPEDLEAWRGKPVRFVFRDQVADLGLTFPSKEKDEKPEKLPELHEVLRPK